MVDRILDHGSSVRDAVETQAERLGDQVEQSMGRFREHMTQLAGRIDEATETSRHETKTMIQATEASQREFTTHTETLAAQIRGSAKQMSPQLTRLADQAVAAAETTAADSAVLEQASRAQVERLSAAATLAGEQFRQSFDRLADRRRRHDAIDLRSAGRARRRRCAPRLDDHSKQLGEATIEAASAFADKIGEFKTTWPARPTWPPGRPPSCSSWSTSRAGA